MRKNIRVYDIIGTKICASAEDGQKLYKYLQNFFEEQKPFVLSFLKIELVISVFLNNSIGQLYGRYDEETIDNLMIIQDMSEDDQLILKRVISNAKRYYKKTLEYDKALESEGLFDE